MKTVRTIFVAALVTVVIGALTVALLVHRGLRANQNPLPLETSVARTMRDLSIPAKERSRKNPLDSSPEVMKQGRAYYLHRCATCHGEDGGARTPVGANLYPKAPDLRAAATQNLTDGEIHYIIENGVELTGMPAVHGESAADSWKLVSFIRSFRSSSPHTQSLQGTHYAGSQSCEKCHSDIYARWKKTPMANVVRDPREHAEAIIPDLNTNQVAKFTKDQVAFVYGSIWKQRYFTRVGDDYFPLPAQWVVGTQEWKPYKVPATGADWWTAFYPDDNMQRPTGPTCDGCHSVGYDIHTRQVAEWNVGCERCHGPGREHDANPTRDNIINPAQMDSGAATDTCIQCHSQGQPLNKAIEGKYYDWPVGYNVGLRLADFWKLEDCTLGQTNFLYFPDCTAHKNRMQGNDFVQSLMYRHGVTCATCHDVHGTSNPSQLRQPPGQLCLDCHGPSSANGPRTATLEEHTHHKAGSAGSQCIACHMPKIESEGVPNAFVHAHTFRFISPAETEKYKIPNPCSTCHQDKSTAWAAKAISNWREPSPWTPMF